MGLRELRPGVFEALLAPYGTRLQLGAAEGLHALGKLVAERARENLDQTSHAYGTPSPASPGGPPSRISGTLRDAVDCTEPHLRIGGWEVRVGVVSGRTPPHGRTPAEVYGRILERGETRSGDAFPWLQPAFDSCVHGGALLVGQYVMRRWHV